jgi:hypothetical protein
MNGAMSRNMELVRQPELSDDGTYQFCEVNTSLSKSGTRTLVMW